MNIKSCSLEGEAVLNFGNKMGSLNELQLSRAGEMVTAVWEQKLATLFHRFDKGGKGHVTRDDAAAQVSAFKTMGYLSSDEEHVMKQAFDDLWGIFLNESESVSLNEWLDGHKLLLKHDKIQEPPLDKALNQAAALMFKAADKERKGAISADGFAVFLACLGVDRAEDARELLNRLAAGRVEIRQEEFLQAFNEFCFQLHDGPSKWLMGPLVS